MALTNHAKKHLQQRAMSIADVEVVMARGTRVPGGYLLRQRDVNEAISELKGEISTLERLKDTLVVADGETIVTAYSTSKLKQKKLLSGLH